MTISPRWYTAQFVLITCSSAFWAAACNATGRHFEWFAVIRFLQCALAARMMIRERSSALEEMLFVVLFGASGFHAQDDVRPDPSRITSLVVFVELSSLAMLFALIFVMSCIMGLLMVEFEREREKAYNESAVAAFDKVRVARMHGRPFDLVEVMDKTNLKLDEDCVAYASTTDIKDFMIDIAKRLHAKKNAGDATWLAEFLVRAFPDCFGAHCALEQIVEHDERYKKKHLNIIQTLIEAGKRTGENVSSYEFRLSRWQRPPRDQAHAASIAYYENRGDLQRWYRRAYVRGAADGITVSVPRDFDAEVPKDYVIKIDAYEVPKDYVIKIDAYEVPIKFERSTMELL